MFKHICEYIKDNVRLEIFMSVILLISVTAIACNMEKVTKEDANKPTEKKLNGKVVVIDPGHGGMDPGKIGVNGVKEKDVNLSIAKKLKSVLETDGFEVVMTRTVDCHLNAGEKLAKMADLNARCRIINDTYEVNSYCVLISIHQNSFSKQSVHGAQSFYYECSPKSRKLGEIVQKKMNDCINIENPKNAKANNSYYMLINSKCPGVIVECGFLSNKEEADKLSSEVYQQNLAEIIGVCLKEYFSEE